MAESFFFEVIILASYCHADRKIPAEFLSID